MRAGDHVRGAADAPLVIVYADFECPFCAAVEERLSRLPVRRVFRHFPVRSKHPRAWPASCAAEAAAQLDTFWPMHDALFAEQGRLEDPHLWGRARELGLDVEQFEALRRSDEVVERVTSDFREGIRAGVVATPTLYVEGRRLIGDEITAWLEGLHSSAHS